MAELTQEAFDALQQENLQLKSQKEELEEQHERLKSAHREQIDLHAQTLKSIRETVQHGGAVVIRPKEPVDGTFTVGYKDAKTGKAVKKQVRFADGHQRVRLADGSIVGAAALMRIAEGGEANELERRTFPALANLTQEAAANRLNDLHKLGYRHLVEA